MKEVINYYTSFDEWGRLERESLEFTINMHHIIGNLPQTGRILDNGAGPGKYALQLAKLGYQMTLSDITPKVVEIATVKAKEEALYDQFEGFHVLDAVDMSIFPDNHFDAVMMLGPLYHLQSEDQRTKAVQELHRVTKPGGTVFVAFMSKVRFMTTSIMNPDRWKPNHTAEGIKTFLTTGIYNHDDPGRFTGAYHFDIAAINPFMESFSFDTVKLIGSRSIAGLMNNDQWAYWRNRGESEFNEIMNLVLAESENPYVLGVSSHLLYIGKKQS